MRRHPFSRHISPKAPLVTLCTYEFTGKAAFIAICTHIAGDSHILKIVGFCLNDPFARARYVAVGD